MLTIQLLVNGDRIDEIEVVNRGPVGGTARQMMAELLDMIEDLGGEADERYYIEMDR